MLTSLALLIFAGCCKAVRDCLSFRFEKSIFSDLNSAWWNPATSWAMKWKDGAGLVEKFPGSSTVFVWVTDAWHFFQLIQYSAIVFAIVFYQPAFAWYWDFAILKSALVITFEIMFRWGFIRR